jgi:hypothetical protein
MNRNYISRRIRRHGITYILKQGATVQSFSAYMKTGNLLWVTALELPAGSLIAPLARPDREYIVASMEDKKLYEEYQLLKINCRGTLARFDTITGRDSFGRSTSTEATPIYLDLPLYLHNSANPTDKSTAAISASSTVYRFTTPTGYTVKPKDQIHIGDSVLTVTSIILTPDNLPTFEAQDA